MWEELEEDQKQTLVKRQYKVEEIYMESIGTINYAHKNGEKFLVLTNYQRTVLSENGYPMLGTDATTFFRKHKSPLKIYSLLLYKLAEEELEKVN